jgi:hypothetical protein
MTVCGFVLGVAFNFGIAEIMKSRNFADTEYAGFLAMRVEYYEDWNQWIDEICTDDNGQEYDCSYSEYNEAYWTMVDNSGFSYRITQTEYNDIVRFVNRTPEFKELDRDYYTNDGDMYFVTIPLDLLVIPITRTREYENRILPNQSLYHYSIISDLEKDSIGLYDYPKIVHYSPHPYPNPFPNSVCAYQSATMGCPNEAFTIRMNVINALCGDKLRTFIFFYPDKERAIAKKQIDRLQLGNFNELIIMLGLKDGEIEWCETHSWEDVPNLRTAVKQWFNLNRDMSHLMDFPDWYSQQIDAGLWTLKDYHDLDYIRIDFSLVQMAWLSLAQIAFQLFIFLYLLLLMRPAKKAREILTKISSIEDSEKVKKIKAKYRNGQQMTYSERILLLDEMKAKEEYIDQWLKRKDPKGYNGLLIMCCVSLVSCIPSILSFGLMESFNSIMIVLVIPCIIGILGIPLCMSHIIAIKRLCKLRTLMNNKLADVHTFFPQ